MAPWPAWVSWLLLIAILLTLFFTWSLVGRLGSLRESLADAGIGRSRKPARNRKELEELYVKGAVSRDIYDRWKTRLS